MAGRKHVKRRTPGRTKPVGAAAIGAAAAAEATQAEEAKVDASQAAQDAVEDATVLSETPAGDGASAAGSEGGSGARAAPAEDTPAAAPWMTAGIAGAVGAVVGAGLVYVALSASGAVSSGGASAEVETLSRAVTAMEQRLAAAGAERKTLQDAQAEIAAAAAAAQTRVDAVQTEVADRDKATAAAIGELGRELKQIKTAAAEGGASAAASAETEASPYAATTEAPQTTPLSARVAALSERLEALEARAGGASAAAEPDAGPDYASLDSRLTAIEKKTDVIVAVAEEAVEKVDTALAKGAPAGDAALGVAFSALAQGIAGSSPYEDAMKTFEKVAGVTVDPAIGDPSNRGLAGRVELARRFDEVSREALRAIADEQARSGGVGSRIGGVFSGLVVVRRTEAVDAKTPEGVISRADAKLAQGALAEAQEILTELPEAGRAAMGDWLKDLETRVAAEKALDALRAELLGAR